MSKLKWWQTAVFYQIYPRSFADGNGDGIGDFKGIIEKLDYIKGLGVDAIWLSPHFPSPNWDWGYDISDYCNVAPEYGTLAEFELFLREAHARNLRVIPDLVLNHTSNEHPWFLESKSSRDNPKSDWYVWQPPSDSPPIFDENRGSRRGVPNNWQSCFDGEAWTYVPERNQYYYHYFMKQQPDLNWHNPEVKAAMWDVVRFWLDMGVDGFRLDAIGTIYEDPDLTPHTVPMTLAELRRFSETVKTPGEMVQQNDQYWHDMFCHQWGQPGLHELMKELRAILDEYDGDRMLVGEDENIDFMGNGDDELHLVFNFPLMYPERITPQHILQNQKERLSQLEALPVKGWPCNTLGNHDSSRIRTRYSDGEHELELARLNAALVLTLRGTPFLYNGEEIGMTDLIITDPAKIRDTMAVWYYEQLVTEFKADPARASARAGEMTRDKNRTPMQWENAPNSGFCPETVEPWLPVNPNYAAGVNVTDQQDDPRSTLNYYRKLLRVRKSTPALTEGEYKPLHLKSDKHFSFLRYTGEQVVLVILNYSAQGQTLKFDLPQKSAQLLFSSVKHENKEFPTSEIPVTAFEVFIAELR